jgi:NAD(P)-dependent dehydrogenase (short-subunit alcohol dehydrogenase family)
MVNNAGISVESTRKQALMTHQTSEEDFDKTYQVNQKGVFLGCKYALEQMLKQDVKFGKEAGWSKSFFLN